jgi:hypothetical protein
MKRAISLVESAGLSCFPSGECLLVTDPDGSRERYVDVAGLLDSDNPKAYAIDAHCLAGAR